MSTEFKRETRYVVLKNADIMQCLTINELIELRRIQARVAEHRAEIGKPPLECVVVEADWPEYEPTWKAIEARMMGSPKESALQTASRTMNIELIRERGAQRAKLDELRDRLETMEKQESIAYQCKVPNGWPTEEMTAAFARVFNSRDQYGTFPQAFRAALAAAPEAKQ